MEKGSPHRLVLAAKGLRPTASLAQPPSPPGSPALPCTTPRTGRDSTGKPTHLQEPRQVTLPVTWSEVFRGLPCVTLHNWHSASEVRKGGGERRRSTLSAHSLIPSYRTNCSNSKCHIVPRKKRELSEPDNHFIFLNCSRIYSSIKSSNGLITFNPSESL